MNLFNNYENLFKYKLCRIFLFCIVFIFFTIIGTLLHEFSHFIVAKFFKFDPVFHYSNVTYGINITDKVFQKCADCFLKDTLIRIAGPFQTISFGTFGLFFLILGKKTGKKLWFGILLTFFWSRQILIFLMIIIDNEISINSDEVRISLFLGIYSNSLSIILGFTGMTICSFVYLIYVPNLDKINFIFGGLLGSLAGYIIWFNFLGRLVFP